MAWEKDERGADLGVQILEQFAEVQLEGDISQVPRFGFRIEESIAERNARDVKAAKVKHNFGRRIIPGKAISSFRSALLACTSIGGRA